MLTQLPIFTRRSTCNRSNISDSIYARGKNDRLSRRYRGRRFASAAHASRERTHLVCLGAFVCRLDAICVIGVERYALLLLLPQLLLPLLLPPPPPLQHVTAAGNGDSLDTTAMNRLS
jgi:hypothetical protein